MSNYSNYRAMQALVKASLQSIFKSPSAIVFSVAFPLIFILVFGFLGGGRGFSIKVAKTPDSDSTSSIYKLLHQVPAIKWVSLPNDNAVTHALSEGDIAATIAVVPPPAGVAAAATISLHVASNQSEKAQQLHSIIDMVLQKQDPEIQKRIDEIAKVDVQISKVRDFKTIDFILPGQLGFSLLASGVFGTAFVFFNLRQTLVLKRFFATPVRREVIVLSEGIARMMFQIMGAVVIILLGHFAFHYTLANGIFTFIQMLLVCALGLMVFMGFGFIVSGLAKSESTIPPLSNIITLPQFLLAGTFFPIDNFPKWLQPICRALPLTYLNDALRKIAFDGLAFWDLKLDMFVLLAWGVVVYVVAGRVFKWE
jgi:ABC-2 type transport system permease protein